MFSIIRDAAKLNTSISKQIAVGTDYYALLHVNAVSALVHIAKHGQNAVLNRFYSALKTNEQSAFVMYVRRFQTVLDDQGFVKKDADGNAIGSELEFLRFEKKEFVLINGRTKEREAFIAFAEDHLINPDGDTYKAFFDRNTINEMRTLGDGEFVKRIRALNKLATDPSGNNTSAASKKMLDLIDRFKTEAEILMAANTVHDDTVKSFDVNAMLYAKAKEGQETPKGMEKVLN